MKTVLVTGGAGYIGSVLIGELFKVGYKVRVLDRMFFGFQMIEAYQDNPDFQLIKDDIRYFDEGLLKGVDTVVDLAGLANDPTCDIDPKATKSINHLGCVRVARLAKKMGVERYIFSSSCSIYGQAGKGGLTEDAPRNPVSLYAEAKAKAEEDILPLAGNDFCATVLRSATVYGLSPKMRFDLVVNVMTMRALTQGVIYVLGGGKQWRPNVHVRDVAKAFMLVMEADKAKVNGQIFNVGSSEQNYQVLQIASMVRDVIPNARVENVPSDPDKRSYSVCFDKIRDVLNYRADRTVPEGILEIKRALENGVVDPTDRRTKTVDYYRYLLEAQNALKGITYKGRIF